MASDEDTVTKFDSLTSLQDWTTDDFINVMILLMWRHQRLLILIIQRPFQASMLLVVLRNQVHLWENMIFWTQCGMSALPYQL